jgi:D-arginine dehydrogenase
MPPPMIRSTEFLIIGGGIAAASTAYWLSRHGQVLLLEQESQPGYHSTGRSAALFMESYGTSQVRALTMASRAFFQAPPDGFSDHPLLTPRGAMMVAEHGQDERLRAHWNVMRQVTQKGRLLNRHEACDYLPVLRPEKILGGIYEPDASDMDVHHIHQGYLRGAKKNAAQLICNAQVTQIQRNGQVWQVLASGQQYEARVLINAAGAWADAVAQMSGVTPIGLVPKRRSALIFEPPVGLNCAAWPMTIGIDESWYIKPDAGKLLGSPANADPVVPHDVQAEEFDIALAIDRIQTMTTLEIRRPIRTWAGLRSFVSDGDLVAGFDPQVENFFWVAAQGGYGIQTSAAMGECCAALATHHALPSQAISQGLTPAMLSPKRLLQ